MTCEIAGNVWEYTKEPGYIAIDNCYVDPGCKHIDVPPEIDGLRVRIIRSNTFFNIPGVESVSIPKNITTLEEESFSFCPNLRTISIGPDVKYMSAYTIDTYCTSVENISIDKANKMFISIDGVLFTKDITKLLLYPMNKNDRYYEVPNAVKEISDYAFYKCEKLKKIYIPSSVIDIAIGNFATDNPIKPYYDGFTIRCDSDSYANKWANEKV